MHFGLRQNGFDRISRHTGTIRFDPGTPKVLHLFRYRSVHPFIDRGCLRSMHDTDCGMQLRSEVANDMKSRGSVAREVRPEKDASETYLGRMTKYIAG